MIVVANWGCEFFRCKLFVFSYLLWGRMPEFCASAKGTIPFSSWCYGLKDKWGMAYAQVSRHVHWNSGQHQEVRFGTLDGWLFIPFVISGMLRVCFHFSSTLVVFVLLNKIFWSNCGSMDRAGLVDCNFLNLWITFQEPHKLPALFSYRFYFLFLNLSTHFLITSLSLISLLSFSRDNTSSSWCLIELRKIISGWDLHAN